MAVVRTTARKAGLRDYVPLLLASLMMLGLLAVLPSALNLPQTTPSETLEYAPVPPEDDITTPPSGNLSSLGLGSSNSIGTTGEAAGPPPDLTGPGGKAVKTPSTKRCVGSPPRQTEDPLSPPCVASYTGDNGGSTYKGVTADEIRIIYFFYPGCRSSSRGRECGKSGQFEDLGKPPAENEDVIGRGVRRLQTYFNERFQTYGRRAHFWVWYNNSFSAEALRARAIEHIKLIDPFAVVHGIRAPAYSEVMARRGVLTFNSAVGTPAEFFRKYPRLMWSYLPSMELHARSYSSMLCKQVVGRPVAFSGNAGENGKPRVLGMLRPDPEAGGYGPELSAFSDRVRADVEACGGSFAVVANMPNGGQIGTAENEKEQQFTQNMAEFRSKGVTTIIWAWGFDLGRNSSAAARQGYFPEWILSGDNIMDGYDLGQVQDQQAFDGHAWIQTVQARSPAFNQDLCFSAMREVDPDTPEEDAALLCRLHLAYEAMRQLFVGIQVAGPRLNPATIDKGYHAIPAGPSETPFVPACYYEPGDYTCIKDATAMYWDRNGQAPGAQSPGCWRMHDEGKRYTWDEWPEQDISARRQPDRDPCNGYSSLSVNVNAGV
jgi:hypothetical protein